jgi:hypothetical protein
MLSGGNQRKNLQFDSPPVTLIEAQTSDREGRTYFNLYKYFVYLIIIFYFLRISKSDGPELNCFDSLHASFTYN